MIRTILQFLEISEPYHFYFYDISWSLLSLNFLLRSLCNFISGFDINSIRNKFELLAEAVMGNDDVLMVTETKIGESFPTSQFVIPGFTSPYRFDRTKDGGEIFIYIREDIPSKLLNISEYIATDIECLGIEVNLRKVKWLVICSYNPHKSYISNHL